MMEIALLESLKAFCNHIKQEVKQTAIFVACNGIRFGLNWIPKYIDRLIVENARVVESKRRECCV